jgi:hypothetical protein
LLDPAHIAQELPDYSVVATRHLQLHDHVAALGIDREDVDVSSAGRKLQARDIVVLVDPQARLDTMEIFCEVVLKIAFIGEL